MQLFIALASILRSRKFIAMQCYNEHAMKSYVFLREQFDLYGVLTPIKHISLTDIDESKVREKKKSYQSPTHTHF